MNGSRSDALVTDSKSVIVIGAGIGGIAAAIRLARAGLRVTVIEKNSHPGGRCDRFAREGHSFDTGPTLMVMPLLYEAELASLGTSAQEALRPQRVDPTYELVFDDGSCLALTSDLSRMYSQLEAIERGSFAGFLRYMQEGRRHYELAMEKLVSRDFRRARDFFSVGNLTLLHSVKPLVPHYRNMARYFRSPRLKAAFTFQDVYMGLSPFEAPATFSMMPYNELAHGVWYPHGGMYRIVEALMSMAEAAGVEFRFDAPVEQIQVDGSRARGVALADGQLLSAGAVLANADLSYVYQALLPQDRRAESISRKRLSCSVISFFWGVDQPLGRLGPHTLFLTDDYRENFTSLIDGTTLPRNPSLYVHAPSRLEERMAPPGQDTLIAIVPVGHMNETEDQDWGAIRDQARQHVFRRLASIGMTDVEEHLKFEVAYLPPSWRRRYNLAKGATHGLSHTLRQLAYFRPGNRDPRYQNLYFVGASTRPGTGIPTALVSARLTATRMLEELWA
jgi:phytoene desaturase